MKNFNMTDSQSNLAGSAQADNQSAAALDQQALYGNQSSRHSSRHQLDEMTQDLNYLARDAPLDGGESTFGAATSYSQLGGASGTMRDGSVMHMGSDLQDDLDTRSGAVDSPLGYSYNEQALEQLAPDNLDIRKPLQQAGPDDTVEPNAEQTLPLKPFLVSFMVDARGSAMRGCRHSGVRVIIPPNSAPMPMRITCRYLRRERLVHPPPLMEGEACASKIMEVGPAGAKFLGPVLIEVPHFASLRGQEREIIILRSDSGDIWREHLVEADERLVDSIVRSAAANSSSPVPPDNWNDEQQENVEPGSQRNQQRVADQEVHTVGPDGSAVNSQLVPRVQAIFTEGALTKRIKIGLQGNKKHPQAQQQQQDQANANQNQLDSSSPSSGQQVDFSVTVDGDSAPQLRSASPDESHGNAKNRPSSPGDAAEPGRPSSAAKRRSRFLACFGAGHGSVDLLNSATDDSSADNSAGGESPRQVCNEKLVERRHILNDVVDSDGGSGSAGSGSPANSLRGSSERQTRARRHVQLMAEADLVPEDYYIEREPPLILNVERKTYGKRLASSSAQTDSKLQGGCLSSSAKSTGKKRGGLLRGRRKHKTQLTIQCGAVNQATRPKSTEPADSSLDTVDEPAPLNNKLHQAAAADQISLIQDVITSDDQKWRTCTIQTDSDSLTVNYVTVAPDCSTAAATGAQDDGYVSGSGDLNNRQSSFGKGLFGLGFGGTKQQVDAASQATTQKLDGDSKRARKQRAKSAEKAAARQKKEAQVSETELELVDKSDKPAKAVDLIEAVSSETVGAKQQQQQQVGDQVEAQQQVTLDESLDSGARSVSPNSKELRQRLKLERRDKERREKEEKRIQKELEEANAKAEKLKRKQEKEAKRAEKAAEKKAKKSPPASKPQTPVPDTSEQSVAAQPVVKSNVNVVKFASDLVESESGSLKKSDKVEPTESSSLEHEQLKQLDSIQRIIETTDLSYEQSKERLSQEDGRDMVRVSISERITDNQAAPELKSADLKSATEGNLSPTSEPISLANVDSQQNEAQLISLASERLDSGLEFEQQAKVSGSSAVLKPILKQQSSTASTEAEASAELVIGGDRKRSAEASKLVSEATEEAVRAANDLQKLAKEASEAEQLAKAKEEKANLKREAKAAAKKAAEEAKRAAEEAKKVKKAEELEKKQLAKKEKAEQERLKKEAKRQLKEASKAKKKATGEEQQVSEIAVTSSSLSEPIIDAAEEEDANLAVSSSTKTGDEEANVEAPSESAREEPSSVESISEKKKGKKKKEAKKKKAKPASKVQKESPAKELSESTTTEPSSSHLSFLERLFGGRKKSAAAVAASTATTASKLMSSDVASADAQAAKTQEKPLILSEMYPSDPDDVDGEMILEVNVPESLIKNNNQQSSGADLAASPTLATTIDETFATTSGAEGEPLVSPNDLINLASRGENCGQVRAADLAADGRQFEEDDQATLVNMSSQIMETDDDEATENVLSQANELPLSEVVAVNESVVAVSSQRSSETIEPSLQAADVVPGAKEAAVASALAPTALAEAEQEHKVAEKTKSQVKAEEKARKELEAKLEKEAKKQAKEEEKERKLRVKEELVREKEAKKAAKLEAKRVAKEEKAAKKAAAKQLKVDKKQIKNKKKGDTEEASAGGAAGPSIVVDGGEVFKSESNDVQGEQAPADDVLDNMTPVNTQTEVQQIVEEVVGEDGVITKTTKTIETKYVTLRQEEVRQSEVREMSVEDYEKLRSEEKRVAGRADSLEHEDEIAVVPLDSQVVSIKTQVSRLEPKRQSIHQQVMLLPYEHEELNAIRNAPSCFGPECAELNADLKHEESPKKLLKRRIKLNQKLIKRAGKLAKCESKRAKKEAKLAAAEIAVCDEAARQAGKELKRAVKETKRATKLALKEHKKMDKIDKKLAKRQKKIEKRQFKLDKRAAKLARKEASRLEKVAKKEAKESAKLERKASQKSRKSIKLEDIGEPVLRTSSRFSIGEPAELGILSDQQQQQQPQLERSSPPKVDASQVLETSAIERASPTSNDDIQVEMSLDDSQALQPPPQSTSPMEFAAEEALASGKQQTNDDDLEDEEIDVVNDLPQIKPSGRSSQQGQLE